MRFVPLLLVLAAPAAVFAARDFGAAGPWAVGTTTLTFTKTSVTTGLPRPLATRFWYPRERAAKSNGAVQKDAPVARRRWPLVVFSHGSCGTPDQSPFFTVGLASWGFVVAAPPHPGNTTFEMPRCFDADATLDSFQNRVADVSFVIDQVLAAGPDSPFARRVSARRIGMSGHSFGAQTTLRVLAADPRVRAGVAMAPPVQAIGDLRIARPAMILGGALDTLTPFATDVQGSYALLTGPRFLIEIDATGHCAFAGACVPSFCGAGCGPADLRPTDAHRQVLRWSIPFLLHYVANRAVGRALRPASASAPVHVLDAHPRP